ncbi:roadblock/LC7 domain-containing protein [Schumannella sp. 10F1B-5-1]|uniref:roadblock/LC7 domain-containing protein n=1 Tax=Schumannella sp. 10F1B-5-1 TaxID=2590780 RepID=UPI0011325E29|nr:roadblock/LC7 domain-containing protein [Schumannella sp. 10F1B-5-1]TPW72288.1 roadblock/LC7 domain-containing protein [Schumannella sp. 10F1B-5-1]
MTIALHQDPAAIEEGRAALAGMGEISPSMVYAALLTDDGFEIVHVTRIQTDATRFASMSSSIQALSDAVGHELRIGASDYVIIGSAQGHVIQMRVPGRPVVLAALFQSHETLGKALSTTRVTAERISHRFAASSVPAMAAPNF